MDLRTGSWRIRLAILLALIAACSVGIHFLRSGANETGPHGGASAGPATVAGATNKNPVPAANASALPSAPTFTLTMKQFADPEVQALLALSPQQQAEQMMRAAVNHYEGATDLIKEHVPHWKGHLQKTPAWDQVELDARYSSDLRVRDAAIEIDLTLNQLGRDSETVARLIQDAQTNLANRGFDLTMLGMLANRDVERSRVHTALRDWAHDPDETTRYWAVEGLAYIGGEYTIPDFLEVLRTDVALNVRQRCGASLAKSGMLTREQRMQAVPGLIDIAADSSQDPTTRGWAFEALREITAQPIGNDAGDWQAWFSAHGDERLEDIRRGDPNAVLGNS
jgi:hypothetical protein